MEPNDKKETAIQAVEAQAAIQQADPASPMAMAMELCKTDSDMSIEKLEKVLELQRQYLADQARKDFTSDFSIVQSKIDAVVKTKVNPQTHSNYAGLDDVLRTAKPVYTAHGFSVIFYEGKADKVEDIRVCADVLHKAGHKETYHYDVPMGGKGIQGKVNMTDIHAKATSVTYGRRYLLCMIWNIPTEDDDGNGNGKTPEPDFPRTTDSEQAVIDKIAETMTDSVPEGLILVNATLGRFLFSLQQRYPDDIKKAGEIAGRVIDRLNKNNCWHTVTKEA